MMIMDYISGIENAGRRGANVPEWLRKYIAMLRDKIDSKWSDQAL